MIILLNNVHVLSLLIFLFPMMARSERRIRGGLIFNSEHQPMMTSNTGTTPLRHNRQLMSPRTTSKTGKDYSQRFGIDCYINGLENLGTDNRVIATFYDSDDDVIETVVMGNGINPCTNSNPNDYIEIDKSDSIRRVNLKIETPSGEGKDALLIHRAWIEDDDGDIIVRWDGDSDKGWCLGTDPNDNKSKWSGHTHWGGKCQDQICFKRSDSKVSKGSCF